MIDSAFSILHRRFLLGARVYSALRRMRLYGIVAGILKKVDANSKEYDTLPRFHVAVCANMSAGKSTLVNALLGKDLLPSRNEATTAKVTSVYDRDGLEKVFGCCVSRRHIVNVSSYIDVDSKRISDWNADGTVTRIHLQSDLNGIGNKTRVVVVHDTPGTNCLLYPTHREITMDFLKRINPDALLYVVNFEHIFTDDQDVLLRDVLALQEKTMSTSVVFAVNKVDSADWSKEDIGKVVKDFERHVRSIGFEKYFIVPVAAKAGRMLKMAMLGRSIDFTEKESDDFDVLFRRFSKRLDVRSVLPSSCRQKTNHRYGCRSMLVSVAGVSYSTDQLAAALDNTGIPDLEGLLDNLISQ